MPGQSLYVAVDLGAESGRVLTGRLTSGKLDVTEIHRFANEPVRYNGEMHWDVARLWLEILRALGTAGAGSSEGWTGIGVDTWGLDYALLGESGTLLDNPFHYRDARTDGMVDRVCEIVPAEEIYRQTGVQFMQINALYQLYAAALKTPRLLHAAEQFGTIPDLFNYWLTGVAACEFTNATTTQFFDPVRHTWARGLLDRLGIPAHLLAPVIEPGTVIGNVKPDIAGLVGIGHTPVIAPACHDTGSAVAAIALGPASAYISSGTWSLLGTELLQPIINAEAQRLNFTNEGGVCGTIRLLKNIAGLWLLQCCRQNWIETGSSYSYPELVEQARSEQPLQALVDPDHASFLKPEAMVAKISAFCVQTGQLPPASPPAFTRTILESLALKYRYVLDLLERLTGMRFEEIRIVGGGAKNKLLNQFTAEATGRRVVAGPVEATALGNIAMQMLATGAVSSLRDARAVIDYSFPVEVYEPEDPEPWSLAYDRFRQYCDSAFEPATRSTTHVDS